MFEAVIFDMDGVLIDSETLHIQLEEDIFKEIGANISFEEHISFVGTTSHYMWEYVKNKCNVPFTVEELVEMDRKRYFDYISKHDDAVKPIVGVDELVKELHKRNMRLAVASSSPIDVIEIVVKRLKLENYFDELVSGDFVKRSKPYPDIFLYAAEKLNVAPERCIVIEDSNKGVLAAKSAGMKVVGFINPNSGNQDISMADMEIRSFSELDYEKLQNI
ncbi:HAD-superfamily hydrolase, subfamily IA, variant 3 [Thermoanaerobacterium xylanolyticum LX-11]|uniref:HAD-superfamily hydrolase, subfamily IA, variant 3 n=1 Tax=Thermoanaerobacterium xylanolyticum (strain ATCC 49914 / DSM 7097 / LX-11) TaxID=858215 RepID=F6BFA7_THEXL|nr:HAD family phosphatase [Thermoanaerobacterium xylanolyticum]AEF16185.1 HAD-superfamily hydrolase, subfamily IA, variant 3 [Thermoanaerobacterium xylanolyticum LX-11]